MRAHFAFASPSNSASDTLGSVKDSRGAAEFERIERREQRSLAAGLDRHGVDHRHTEFACQPRRDRVEIRA
jgi:hypothetical protein